MENDSVIITALLENLLAIISLIGAIAAAILVPWTKIRSASKLFRKEDREEVSGNAELEEYKSSANLAIWKNTALQAKWVGEDLETARNEIRRLRGLCGEDLSRKLEKSEERIKALEAEVEALKLDLKKCRRGARYSERKLRKYQNAVDSLKGEALDAVHDALAIQRVG